MKKIVFLLVMLLPLTIQGAVLETPTGTVIVIAKGCGYGIAAKDLAGTCRVKPNATMGALEAR